MDMEVETKKERDEEGEESDVELEGVDMEEEALMNGAEMNNHLGDETNDEQVDSAALEAARAKRKAQKSAVSPLKGSLEWQEARRAQKERLASMKTYGTTVGANNSDLDEKEQRERRLQYLMAQSEVFSHFMEDSMASAGSGIKKSGKKGRTKVSEAVEDASMLKSAQSKLRVHRVEKQPECIKATLRPYQLEGLNWLVRLHDNGINGILADEMGLGKTLQSISLLAYLSESRNMPGPHVCIVPKSVVNNWIREFKKWCPTVRTVKLLGSKDERARVVKEELSDPDGFDVCVTSYEGVLKEKSALCKIDWQYLLIDEAHRIKNPKSSLSRTVRIIPTQFRLLITGTPLQNNLNELWALLNFLLPDIFASETDFESWFSIEADNNAKENVVKKLHTVLRPFMLRRIKKDVETDLPPKREVKLYIGLTKMQRDWYTKILSKDAHLLNALGGPDRVQLLNILMQLRKVCNHPYLFEGAEPGPPYIDGAHLWENAGKLVLLNKLLPKLKAQSSRVLIFSQMTRMLDILEDYMRLTGHDYCRIDGSTHGDERDSQMDEFNAPNSPKFCFLLSTRAGGLGINLATADIVVLYDSDWNPQVDLQAMDRAHRIGQTKPVTVFRFVSEGTVEEKIIERADRKLFLDAAVIQQGRLAEQNAAMSKNDLMTMVRFGADEIFSSKQATLSDEDIDTLLKRGEERTQEQAAKIQSDVQHNLADFSLTTKDAQEESLFAFEGADYREQQKSGKLMINLPQRERKKNYDVDEYFRDAMRSREPGPGKKAVASGTFSVSALENSLQKAIKDRRKGLPPMYDFQFFDKTQLYALIAKEDELATKRHEALIKTKELRNQAANAQKDDPAQAVEFAQLAEALELRLDTDFELGPSDAENKKILLEEGFSDWTRKDYRSFLAALERRGRADVQNICRDVATETNRQLAQIERYHNAFWRKYQELPEWEKIIDKVQKGEKRLARANEIRQLLASKVQRHASPWQCLPVNYGSSRGKVWTEEEDAFLINMMHTYGYGNWERIRIEIRNAWQFNFDWFFRSRSPPELQKRADLLIKSIEREKDEHINTHQSSLKAKSPGSAFNPGQKPKKEDTDQKSLRLSISGNAKKKPAARKRTSGVRPGRKPATKKAKTEDEEQASSSLNGNNGRQLDDDDDDDEEDEEEALPPPSEYNNDDDDEDEPIEDNDDDDDDDELMDDEDDDEEQYNDDQDDDLDDDLEDMDDDDDDI